jgi:antitoxin component of RelBE/YafQ-DinJ toxin-antitoxin module
MIVDTFSILVNPYLPRTTTLVLSSLLGIDPSEILGLMDKQGIRDQSLPVHEVHDGVAGNILFHML